MVRSRKKSSSLIHDKRAAEQLWEGFRETKPGRTKRISIQWPKALMVMGRVRLIAYDTTHGGKFAPYEHEFAPGSRPLLCAGRQSGQLFLIGADPKTFRATRRGIVDTHRDGRPKKYRPRLKVVRRR